MIMCMTLSMEIIDSRPVEERDTRWRNISVKIISNGPITFLIKDRLSI